MTTAHGKCHRNVKSYEKFDCSLVESFNCMKSQNKSQKQIWSFQQEHCEKGTLGFPVSIMQYVHTRWTTKGSPLPYQWHWPAWPHMTPVHAVLMMSHTHTSHSRYQFFAMSIDISYLPWFACLFVFTLAFLFFYFPFISSLAKPHRMCPQNKQANCSFMALTSYLPTYWHPFFLLPLHFSLRTKHPQGKECYWILHSSNQIIV